MTFGGGLFGSGTFGDPSFVGWVPGDAWPGPLEGGAVSPKWGGYVRLWVRAAIAAGNSFHIGDHAYDNLDAGNVLAGAVPVGRTAIDRLWVDLTCDVLDVDIAGGASKGQGIFTKADAATCTVTFLDPDGKYDPLNPVPPWQYQGRTRLLPGVPVEVFAEVIDDPTAAEPTVTRYWLFTGTADSWGEDWKASPYQRTATLIASDATKQWVKFDRPETAAVGAGDTTDARVDRLVTYYGWGGPVTAGTGTVTLAATTLAQPGWELLNRTLDDELGVVFFTTEGALRWVGRQAWFTLTEPALTLGCPDLAGGSETFYDVLVDASPSNLDLQMRNAVYAARTGGTVQTATSSSSIDVYGTYEYKRTDLGLADDTQVGEWATTVVELYAYPQIVLADITHQPALHTRSWESWADVLDAQLVTDLVRVVWAPPDHPTHVVDTISRVVGYSHTISRALWEVKWQLVDAQALRFAGSIFTLGGLIEGPPQYPEIPGNINGNQAGAEFGVKYLFDTDGYVAQARYKRSSGYAATTMVRAWNDTTTAKITEVADSQTAIDTWLTVTFPTPIAITAGQTITFSVGAFTAGAVGYKAPPDAAPPTDTADVTFVDYRTHGGGVNAYPDAVNTAVNLYVAPVFVPVVAGDYNDELDAGWVLGFTTSGGT